QITLSFVLLASAGLLVKSLLRLQAINLGFSPAGITTMSLEGRGVKQQFYEQLLARVQQMPGIESASVASTAPLLGHNSITIMEIKGQPENHDAGPPAVGLNVISPNYFSTLGIHLVRGRAFTEQDRIGAPRVAVINQAAAKRFFAAQDPLGQRIKLY